MQVDVALGAGMHRGHRQRRVGPGQGQPDRSYLGQRGRRVRQSAYLRDDRDDVIGGVLSLFVGDSESDTGHVESSCRPDDDLIGSGAVKTKFELRPTPEGDEKVLEQRIDDRSDRADGHGDRRPGVDTRAENG